MANNKARLLTKILDMVDSEQLSENARVKLIQAAVQLVKAKKKVSIPTGRTRRIVRHAPEPAAPQNPTKLLDTLKNVSTSQEPV